MTPSASVEQEVKKPSVASRASKSEVSTQAVQRPQDEDPTSQPVPIQVSKTVTISIRNLVQKNPKGMSSSIVSPGVLQAMPVPGTIKEVDAPEAPMALRSSQLDVGGPLVPSPGPVQNFQGEFDEAQSGTSSFVVPPDTMGAVGIDKIVTSVNNNVVIQDKATGARLSVVSLLNFWAATGAAGVFDPRVIYDPYNNRWLVAAVAGAQTANSSVLVGVSNTSDPQGTYTLFRFIVGCAAGAAGCNANGEWADFPMLGFNKNWVSVSWNQFTINTNANIAGKVMILDYPTMRAGTANAFAANVSAENAGFCLHPATTFSATENTLYYVGHLSSAGATYRVNTITGVFPTTPTLTIGPTMTRPGGGWTQPGGDTLPQQCIPGVGGPTQTCPATNRRIDSGDAFIRSNVVFRNNKIYYPQTIALPAGGLTTSSRFAAQWTVVNTSGVFVDGGRVEDSTANIINGGKNYAYPSIAVNKSDAVMFGFSEFESDDYADAGYTFRLAGDAAGTMRDPVIYKEGEDYYSKTFSGTRNRWGDYSHTVVDPVNDRDLWTTQEYAGLRVGASGQGSNDSRWATWWAKVAGPAGPGDLKISEFRLRGPDPNSASNEYIEIYNSGGSTLTVQTIDGSAGYSLVASDGVVRFTIPNGTIIPAKGHYLGVNSIGYSLASHPAGIGTTATGDATYTTDIPDTAGIALFATADPASFNLANRLDAVGSTAEADSLYKEGSGYPAIIDFDGECAFYRSFCSSNTPVYGSARGCTPGGDATPKDTDNNAVDFVFVDTLGAGQLLGAPGPENLSSPTERNTISVLILDSTTGANAPPNRVRDLTADPANNSSQGTLEFRRRIQNNTGAPVTRLRLRVVDITTFPAASGFADLRTRTSSATEVSGIGDAGTCSPSAPPCSVTLQGTTLEEPPPQPNGGAFNSTYGIGTVTLATPLAPGESINIRLLVGVQQTGLFRFFLNVEALP